MPRREDDVALVRAGLEVFNAARGPRGLLERFDEFFTADLSWRPALIGSLTDRLYHARDGFADYVREFEGSFPDAAIETVDVRPVGDGSVVVHGHVRTAGAASGAPVEQEVGYVFRMRGGRISQGSTHLSHAEADEVAHAPA